MQGCPTCPGHRNESIKPDDNADTDCCKEDIDEQGHRNRVCLAVVVPEVRDCVPELGERAVWSVVAHAESPQGVRVRRTVTAVLITFAGQRALVLMYMLASFIIMCACPLAVLPLCSE